MERENCTYEFRVSSGKIENRCSFYIFHFRWKAE